MHFLLDGRHGRQVIAAANKSRADSKQPLPRMQQVLVGSVVLVPLPRLLAAERLLLESAPHLGASVYMHSAMMVSRHSSGH